MKKLTAILIAAVMLLAFTSCGGEDGGEAAVTTPRRTTTTGAADVGASAGDTPARTDDAEQGGTPDAGGIEGDTFNAMKWMMGGTYSFDFTMSGTAEGVEISGSGSIAADGGKNAVTMNMNGMVFKVVTIGEKAYMIDDASKTIMVMPAEDADTAVPTDFTGMELTGSGTGEVNGKTLPYEEYSSGGNKTKFFLEGNKLYAIVTEEGGGEMIMILSNQSDSVPAGAFDLPSDYSQIDMSDMLGGLGDMGDFGGNDFDMEDFDMDDYLAGLEGYLPEGFEMPGFN